MFATPNNQRSFNNEESQFRNSMVTSEGIEVEMSVQNVELGLMAASENDDASGLLADQGCDSHLLAAFEDDDDDDDDDGSGLLAGQGRGSGLLAEYGDDDDSGLLADWGSASKTTVYPPPKIRIGMEILRDFPPSCGREIHASSSNPPKSVLEPNQLSRERESSEESLKVRKALSLFNDLYNHLSEEHKKAKSYGKFERSGNRIDLEAAKILKNEGKWVNRDVKLLGNVPGVEIGDQFHYRIQLVMIGLHHQSMGGIDYPRRNGKILATSIVSTGNYYVNGMESPDILIYSGQGGNPKLNHGKSEDQKLERGNLALKNSMDMRTPVRVIKKRVTADIYVYDGLYTVTKCRQERGEEHGNLVFMFELHRIPGQPRLN